MTTTNWNPVKPGKAGPTFAATTLLEPFKWRTKRKPQVSPAVDLFNPTNQIPEEEVERVFAVMAANPKHDFVVRTERPDLAHEFLDRVERSGRYVIRKDIAHAWRDPRDGTRLQLPEDLAWPPTNIKIEELTGG